ncbi:hypothetical protein P7C70_g1667, partial [Phenoliferia sp. Uapishka_3]
MFALYPFAGPNTAFFIESSASQKSWSLPRLFKIPSSFASLKLDTQAAHISIDAMREETLHAVDRPLPSAVSALRDYLSSTAEPFSKINLVEIPTIFIDTSFLTPPSPDHLDVLAHLAHPPQSPKFLLIPTPDPHAHYHKSVEIIERSMKRRAATNALKKAVPVVAVSLETPLPSSMAVVVLSQKRLPSSLAANVGGGIKLERGGSKRGPPRKIAVISEEKE